MRTAIIYMSRHGTSAKAARALVKHLGPASVRAIDLRNEQVGSLDGFGQVILGGSIHGGKLQPQLSAFCEKRKQELLQKSLGLYICHMKPGQEACDQFDRAFPESLRKHARARGLFGGEFLLDRMNPFEKVLLKATAGVEQSICKLDMEAIARFGNKMQH
ncbi:MAG: hypothetical protein KI790_06740 [Cyclobacteriaceae bacterium]|nr:hypothetical protein [Cyclobacteriaceae bacterium HetDA_MAG_MS6]